MLKSIRNAVLGPLCLITLSYLAGPGCAVAKEKESEAGVYLDNPQVKDFINDMVEQHDFEAEALNGIFAKVRRQNRILEVIQRPAEGKPWFEYRPIFLTHSRIKGGVNFWNENAQILEQAQAVYGVPPEYIVAIIGVETYYGRRTGGFRVVDALTTLGFDYPPRAAFFKRELEAFLLLAREESLDPLALKGSYAGAMGKGQFIPSSYRQYAVDFDGDETRDLWGSSADAIGSVANYFKRHGWRTGEPVAVPARLSGKGYEELLGKGIKPELSLEALAAKGVEPDEAVEGVSEAAFLEFEGEEFNEYWLGFKNFYVITRYNHSALYAMAVHQLAQAIKRKHERQLDSAGE